MSTHRRPYEKSRDSSTSPSGPFIECEDVKDLAKLSQALNSLSKDSKLEIPDLKDLIHYGQWIWEISYKHTNDDHEALDLLMEHARKLMETDEFKGSLFTASLLLPHEQITTLFVGRWGDQAFPRILIEAKYASLLMATDVNEDALEYVIPPWKAFLIEFQEPIIECFCEHSQKNVKIIRIAVQVLKNQFNEDVWNFIAIGESNVQLWRHGLYIRDLCKILPSDHDWENIGVGLAVENIDERAMLLIGRLIVSTCLAMSDPENFHEQKKTKGRGKKWHFNKTPETRNVILGKPVGIDCRPAIRSYMEGNRKTSMPHVRFLVRGHWKKVAYGPQSSLRKIQHISPYWKGPEEADIVAKTIKLGKKESKK